LDYIPSSEEIQKAIDMAQCDFFADFPDGLQTEIGEK
jgi:ABC-type multidrug transport system fused ATPase/permease subunit